ncbi:hypothetical protein C8J56DRAFT_855779 [Mycena floridula]|nr:hypothetical protein C8J56DRAFT_855779 [Mycena floridula]
MNEDAQNLATEFIWSLDTVHREVRHLLEELKHKETRAQDLQEQVDHDSARFMRSKSDSTNLLPEKIARTYEEIHSLCSDKASICQRIIDLIQRTSARLDSEVGKIKILTGEDLPAPAFHPIISREVTPAAANFALNGRDAASKINDSLKDALSENGNKRRKLTAAASSIAISSNLKAITPAASPPPTNKRGVRARPSTTQVAKPLKSEKTTKEKKRVDVDVEMKADEPELVPEVIEEDDGDDRNYCICQKPSYGDMIACDGQGCPYEWFHLSCLGLKGPLGDDPWYCSHCAEAPAMVIPTVPRKRGRPSASELRDRLH